MAPPNMVIAVSIIIRPNYSFKLLYIQYSNRSFVPASQHYSAISVSITWLQKTVRASETLEGSASARDTVVGFSLSVTAGFLIWMLRGGALLASMFSISPLWKQLDPLPILSTAKEDGSKSSDDDSVEALFGKGGKRLK